MERLTANPLPLDAAARDELARKAEAAKARADQTHAPRWYKPFELRSDTDYAEDAEFLAACSPDVILALLAAVERGEAETRDAERYRTLRTMLFEEMEAVEDLRTMSPQGMDAALDAIAVATAARAHPPIKETDADAK